MDPQINQLNRLIHSEHYQKAELYYKGLKYGEYYTWLKRAQGALVRTYQALAPFISRPKRRRCAKSAGLSC